MGKNSEYYLELDAAKKKKVSEIKNRLPKYTHTFINRCELDYQPNTVIAYAEDLFTFFTYIKETNPLYRETLISEIPESVLNELTFEDINDYQAYLSYSNGESCHNSGQTGIKRKMAALRNFYAFMNKNEYLHNNPTIRAASGKRKKKDAIIRMDSDEVHELIKAVENTDLSSKRAKSASEKTMLRDTAIITLMLNTGIRVSECVGLDLDDINFFENTITIVRKGGSTSVLYFNEDVRNTLRDYILHERNMLVTDDTNRALFISQMHNRMSVRSIQYMVKKFSQEAVQGKIITPHKLRSTYGTALYRATGDIYLVADVLGHKDVNTTVKHYAAMDEEHRKQAAQYNPYS
ncbi:MAG: tyrosine-type recombinase/integrase [Butyrivibrio sp.]|nr:tyrosine-type recombinase/integrase [Butyrivibrio sp.]